MPCQLLDESYKATQRSLSNLGCERLAICCKLAQRCAVDGECRRRSQAIGRLVQIAIVSTSPRGCASPAAWHQSDVGATTARKPNALREPRRSAPTPALPFDLAVASARAPVGPAASAQATQAVQPPNARRFAGAVQAPAPPRSELCAAQPGRARLEKQRRPAPQILRAPQRSAWQGSRRCDEPRRASALACTAPAVFA